MNLDVVRRTFEKLGREDPLYGVLTDHSRRHNKWDPDEFLATGVKEIGEVIAYLNGLGLTGPRKSALDFGCGVGRLSQALAAHFERIVGVDIADSMIQKAREFNKAGDRVEFMVNTKDDLTLLKSDSFDFVYSNITLQHIPPESSTRYMREFFRVLRPGGVAVFQVPSGKEHRPGSLSDLLYTFRRRYVRRFWKIIRGRAPYEMHYVPLEEVKAIIASAGKAVDIVDVGRGKMAGRGTNYRYCAVKQR
jgi:ubiquinone/menaquinone biosynthesis C-methylase UbiE